MGYGAIIHWRIQDFPDGGANSEGGGTKLLFDHFFPKTARKRRNLVRRGVHVHWAPLPIHQCTGLDNYSSVEDPKIGWVACRSINMEFVELSWTANFLSLFCLQDHEKLWPIGFFTNKIWQICQIWQKYNVTFKNNYSLKFKGKWVFHDRRFCQIIWQIFTQGRAKKNHQKLPPVGFETSTSSSSGQCFTNWAKSAFSCQPESSWLLCSHALLILEMNKVQHVKWCMKLTSEFSCPTDSCLAQLVRHWPEDLEVLVSNPTGGNFWRIFFYSSLCKDLSDNLTETPIVKNSKGYLIFPILARFCVLHQIEDLINKYNSKE